MLKEESRFAPSGIMEGMISFRAVIAGIESGVSDRRIEKVLFDRAKLRQSSGHLSYIKAMSHKHSFELVITDADKIDALSVGSSHGGIITICTDRSIPRLAKEHLKENGFYMMLDGIEDPYNFGYALRSIYASGADGIILTPRNWMSAAGVVCRASAGASEQLPLFVSTPQEAADIFKAAGYSIVCADIDDSVSVWEADLKAPLFVIVGGEKRGISSELMQRADRIVRIDYGRDFPAALSAASASSIIAFEVLRQNKK